MRKRTTSSLPILTFGAGTGSVTIASGRRGRVSVTGKGSFSPAEFGQFLHKLRWYHEQLTDQVTISKPQVDVRQEETTPSN